MTLVHVDDAQGSPDINAASDRDRSLGLIAVLSASLTSATAGVLLEKKIKAPSYFTHTGWSRNVQLSTISIPIALAPLIVRDPYTLITGRFLVGFDRLVWVVIALQAAGGIIVAYVMKFASNILKCMAISSSICCCTLYSVMTNEIDLTLQICAGVPTVILSVLLFSNSTARALKVERREKSHALLLEKARIIVNLEAQQ